MCSPIDTHPGTEERNTLQPRRYLDVVPAVQHVGWWTVKTESWV